MINKLPIEPHIEELMNLPDPRINCTRKHLLNDVIILTTLAVLCGADSGAEVERFGRAKRDFLRRLPQCRRRARTHPVRTENDLDAIALGCRGCILPTVFFA